MNQQIQQVLQALLSADNQHRLQAENYVNQLPLTNFQYGIDAFLSGMSHQNPQVAAMAALLLKKKYLDVKQTFQRISRDKLQLIVKTVKQSMTAQRPLMFLKRCCDILVKVYTYVDQKRQLMTLIQDLAKSSDSLSFKITLMYLIEIICQFAFDDKMLVQYSGALQNIFQVGLNDNDNQVRVASFKTLTVFLASIQDPNVVKKFESVLQLLLQKAIDLIKSDQESGITAIESLNELIEAHPKFIKPIFKEILMIFTEIMEAQGLLVNLRISAMYGVLILAMNHASIMRKSEYFKAKMVPTYMKMLSENQSIPLQQWSHELNEEIVSKTDIALSTQQHLGQMMNQLGNKFMLPLFIQYIQQALNSSQPCAQHAGLTAMAIMTEGCHESYKKELSNIVGMMMPLIQTQNPRIVYDLLVAMGYMAQQFSPDFQKNYGDVVLQFINRALTHPFPKVQYRAVQCIQNFQTGLKETNLFGDSSERINVLQPYLDTMLSQLGKIFQYSLTTTNCFMLQAVLDSIATIASMNKFAKYYVTFMPGLKKLISMISSDTAQKSMIRCKTIQTMGYLLSSVKDTQELFLPDCKEIMESLIQMTTNLEDKDDPIFKATYIVYENVCNCLKEEFAPYANRVFDRVLDSVNRKVDFQLVDEGQNEKDKNKKNQYVKMKLDFKIDGLKNLVLNTDSFQQKLQACNLLTSMSQDLGAAFHPYIQRTLPTICQLISFKNNRQVRSNMIQISLHLTQNCTNLQQKTYILTQILPSMLQELSTVVRLKDHEEVNQIVEVLAQMMPFMNEEMKAKMPEIVKVILTAVKSLTKEVEKVYADKEMDQQLQEQMDGQIEDVQEVLEYVQKIISIGNNQQFESLKQFFPKEYEFGQLEGEMTQ